MKVQQIIFIILLLVTGFFAFRLYGRVIANIRLGKAWTPDGKSDVRWKNLILVAFGQRKMFKRMLPAVFHLFIYVAFVITQIELIEILVDGVFGIHRFFAAPLGSFYTFVISSIELLSVLAFVATLIFLWRRNVKRVARFENPEMQGWPRLDANLILVGELLLIIGILTMNSADLALQSLDPSHYQQTGSFLISGSFLSEFVGQLDLGTLIFLERGGWWLHI
ncbi:MAG: Fe-S oxidoreductase, partial [Saprospiraceae bacterium]|nr:Fe-S oxidoreductase [Saprospiraceae bacterium]